MATEKVSLSLCSRLPDVEVTSALSELICIYSNQIRIPAEYSLGIYSERRTEIF